MCARSDASFSLTNVTQSNTPLWNSSLNDSVVEATPLFDRTLKEGRHCRTEDFSEQHVPDFVVDRIKSVLLRKAYTALCCTLDERNTESIVLLLECEPFSSYGIRNINFCRAAWNADAV